jgi:large subunit ribosomal protein L30
MASLRIKLVRSMSGHPSDHRATLRGLGLTRVGRERLVEDTPAIRGMVAKVRYALQVEETQDKFEKFGRRHRATAQREASAKGQSPSRPPPIPGPSRV